MTTLQDDASSSVNGTGTGEEKDTPVTQPRSLDVHGWRPIKTAPKDGTWVLVFENPGKPLDTVMWNDFHDAWRNGYNDHPSHPTHWMPLPAPPEAP